MRKKTITENPKAAAAKERKKAVQEEKEAKKEREIEDAKWIEHDKLIIKKQQKKEMDERKKQEQIKRKAEAKALLETEMASIEATIKSSHFGKIITRAEIETLKEERPKKKKEKDVLVLENLNRTKSEHEQARTVDEAIKVLGGDAADVDKHPEKRMKAAYKAFEERRLQELKVKNPTLRASQLKQIIYKEWQKSPENPYNRGQSGCRSYVLRNYRLIS